jgi:hypothetical protein
MDNFLHHRVMLRGVYTKIDSPQSLLVQSYDPPNDLCGKSFKLELACRHVPFKKSSRCNLNSIKIRTARVAA